MCVSCGCRQPDDDHGDERNITVQDIAQAAKANNASIEETFSNLSATMNDVLVGRLQSRALGEEGDQRAA